MFLGGSFQYMFLRNMIGIPTKPGKQKTVALNIYYCQKKHLTANRLIEHVSFGSRKKGGACASI